MYLDFTKNSKKILPGIIFSLSFSLSFFGLLVVVAVLGVEAGSSPSERSSFGDSPANGNGS